MSNKIIYAVAGLFDTPDQIVHATKETEYRGYKNYDVNTPYPVHGMSNAMRLKPSTLGYIALILGLSGAAIAMLFMYWSMTIDYPQIIGGKPTFSLPAFIPVTFEVTVLLASVGTVLAMLFFFFKLPNNSHPLHDTNYMKKVSNDKFGLYIEAKDKKFNEDEVKNYLTELGAKEIEIIYYDDEAISFKAMMFDPKFIGFLAIAFIVTASTSYFFFNKWKHLPPRNYMWVQDKLNPQSQSKFFADGFGMRKPVAGTISKGNLPYEFIGLGDTAAVGIMNPIMITNKTLSEGKELYNTYCSPCHGWQAKGDSRLNNQFPNPPSLHSEKLRNWTDGQIYHVIVNGQNIMPSYAKLLNPEERWKVVNYIRALQRALNAKEEDFQ